MTGQATSLDHTSPGLLSVMQELTSRTNRREPSRSLTAIAENDWTKRMVNFAPYGQFLWCLSWFSFILSLQRVTCWTFLMAILCIPLYLIM